MLTCQASHVVSAADMIAGSFTNTAFADSDETAQVSDDATVPLIESCPSTAVYLGRHQPTDLLEVVTTTNPFTYPLIGTATIDYNAMAYRPADGKLYAFQGETNNLVTVDMTDGSTTLVGPVPGMPANPASKDIYFAGAFAPDGLMYVGTTYGTGSAPILYAVDVDTQTVDHTITLPPNVRPIDLAWYQGQLYFVNNESPIELMSVDPYSGALTTYPMGNTGGVRFGMMVSASNGIFGIANDGSGFYQFDPVTGAMTQLSSAGAPGDNNDAAHCHAAPMVFATDLGITKDDGQTNYVPGTTVTYTITATNHGPFGVQGATFTDTLPAGITSARVTNCTSTGGGVCNIAGPFPVAITPPAFMGNPDLPSGATVTWTIEVDVPATYIGNLANTATIDLPDGFIEPTPDGHDNTAIDTDTPTGSVSVVKDGPATATTNSSFNYTLTVTNDTGGAISTIIVQDQLPAGVVATAVTPASVNCGLLPSAPGALLSCTIPGPIAAGGSTSFDITVTAPASGGTITNYAATDPTGDGTDPDSPPGPGCDTTTTSCDDVTTTIDQPQADLSIAKDDGSTTYTPGGTITYMILASNAGPSDVTGAVIADTVPASITGVTWTATYGGGATGPANGSGNAINITADIPNGGSVTITVTGTMDAGTTGNLVNTATVTPPAGVTDPDTTNNSSTDTDKQTANVTITKSLTGESGTAAGVAEAGEQLTYQITLTNSGGVAATGYGVTDQLDPNVAFVSADKGGSHAGGTVTWTGLTVPANGSLVLTVVVTVNDPIPAGTTQIVNVAYETGTTAPTCPPDTGPGCVVMGTSEADLVVTKTGPATVDAGGTITWTVVVTNNGPQAADGAVFSDTLPADVSNATATCGVPLGGAVCGTVSVSGSTVSSTIPTLPAGGSVTFVIIADVSSLATSDLVNTADVAPPPSVTDSNLSNNSDSATTSINGAMTFVPVPSNATWVMWLLLMLLMGFGVRRILRTER